MSGQIKRVLITGGTGSIGRQLTKALLQQGYEVSLLSRKPGNDPLVRTFTWNVNAGHIDENCIEGIDVVIHLAGAGIADKKWTEQRKKELTDSRTNSIALIYHLLKTRPNTGALPQMALPVKLFAGASLGNGKQWIPWIHHSDVIGMYLFALENEKLEGVFNMVAPEPATNKQLTKAIAKQLHRPVWPFNVPAFVLNLLLGEMSIIVLGSTRAAADKIINAGYVFKYPALTKALEDIYR